MVAIDDGGRSGVRFGCNDSLVGVGVPPESGVEPLVAALDALLDPSASFPTSSGLYNALAASSLRYVSGYFDGSTVVVNLSGTLRPGGVCDNPRIRAQLTQTAVTATGASRAEIYIDGRTLGDVLNLK